MGIEKKKENKFLFYLLSFTWGIMWTLIGLIALIFVAVFMGKSTELFIYRGRIFVEFKDLNFGGASLGIVIFVSSRYEPLMSHEIGHTIQNTWFGPLFIFLVAIPSGIRYQLMGWLRKRHYKKYGTRLDYDAIWFEGQATALGERYTWN